MTRKGAGFRKGLICYCMVRTNIQSKFLEPKNFTLSRLSSVSYRSLNSVVSALTNRLLRSSLPHPHVSWGLR